MRTAGSQPGTNLKQRTSAFFLAKEVYKSVLTLTVMFSTDLIPVVTWSFWPEGPREMGWKDK